jgi:NAD(P)H dehydrogenase (quinone)
LIVAQKMERAMDRQERRRVLVLGATGQVGRPTVEKLLRHAHVEVLAGSRRPKAASGLGTHMVAIDLDQPATIDAALDGVDSVLLITGYSVDMLRQSKSLVDAARRRGVSHIVHLGACGDNDTDVAHYGWHQFVERYIEWSGIGYTHLRPEVFLQNLLGYSGVRTVSDGVIRHYVGHARQVWIDVDDIAEVAAAVLASPEQHQGMTYRLGYDLKSLDEIAGIMMRVLGKPFRYEPHPPEEFLRTVLAAGGEPAYMDCAYRSFVRLGTTGIPGSEEVFDNFQAITGRAPTLVEDFICKNADAFDY